MFSGLFLHPAFRRFFRGYTDYHCHLLPGVDDGVPTMDETLRILSFYESLGVSAVWLTPHVMEDVPNTPARLRQRYHELRQAYRGTISLHLAAEHMLDNLFTERLSAGDVLPLGDRQQHLLVETSYFSPPMELWTLIDRIKSHGYHPVLAHPERYVYMDADYYSRLKQCGVLFQLNLFSLAGAYGKEAEKKAVHLLRKGMYDLSGTDTHSYTFLLRSVERKCKYAEGVRELMDN